MQFWRAAALAACLLSPSIATAQDLNASDTPLDASPASNSALPAIVALIALHDLGDFCEAFVRSPLAKRATTSTVRTTKYTSTRTLLATTTVQRVTTTTQVVTKTGSTVYKTSTASTIAPPLQKRSHHDVLRARDAVLPAVLQPFPAESVRAACSLASERASLEKRARKKKRAVTKTQTVYAVRTVTSRVTRTSLSTATNLRTTTLPPVTKSVVVTSTCIAKRPTAKAESPLLSLNGVNVGMLPDWGIAGPRVTMAQLNALINVTGNKHATFGYYAQAHADTPFDGAQLLGIMDDLKASGAIFEPAVMPVASWAGFTQANNSQAIRVAQVMRQFTDQGIQVRLRFAHEANWYQTDGTYSGTAADFKIGWAVVAAAIKVYAPLTKMFWTPNIASISEYREYQPDDLSTVDYFGIDYYPSASDPLGTAFVTAMKAMYQEYAPAAKMAVAETGLGFGGTVAQRMTWFRSIIESKSTFPYLASVSWFDYLQDYNFRICDPTDPVVTDAYVRYLTGC